MIAAFPQGLPLDSAWLQAVSHHQAGHLHEAEQLYRAILQVQPNHPDANHNLGVLAAQVGQLAAGLPYLKAALVANPVHEQYILSYSQALLDSNLIDEALAAIANYKQCGINSAAVEILQQRIQAIVLAKQTNRDAPNTKEIDWLVTLFAGQRYLEMENHSRKLLERYPDSGIAWKALGTSLHNQGKTSLPALQQAIQLLPDDAEAHNTLGDALKIQQQFGQALVSCQRALEINPNFAEAHNNLGNAFRGLGQLDNALASYKRALELNPEFGKAHSNFGNALHDLGHYERSAASCRHALTMMPEFAEIHSNLLFVLGHHVNVDPQSLFSEHLSFSNKFEAPLYAQWPMHNNNRDSERPLQIGFVSGDLRNHAVASFIEPILIHLAGRSKLSLHAYYNYGTEDDVTHRIKALVQHWHPIFDLSDEVLVQKIRADGIDILIDLSGHTAHNRLPVFARKPAPVQVSWIGYPGTTGLRNMDYYLADRSFLPVEQFADQFTEKIVYLPSATPFLPFPNAPCVNPLPAFGSGYMTFASFSRANKISRPVISLWAQLLRALPNSHMLLGSLVEGSQRENLLTWFTDEGIAHERLFLHPRRDMATYLGLHHQVDLCLDTFPYTGGTTTCHALWMGVPTLTLAGNTPFGRDGAGLLGGLGLEAFVAHDHDDFVRKGVAWAGQLDALAAIRSQLRERIAHSPLGQPGLVADGLEQALRTMWRRWCNGLPVEHF